MEETILKACLDDQTTVYVSPLGARTVAEYLRDDNLGGSQGYFVVRELREGDANRFEILAKAASFDAANELFDMIIGSGRRAGNSHG